MKIEKVTVRYEELRKSKEAYENSRFAVELTALVEEKENHDQVLIQLKEEAVCQVHRFFDHNQDKVEMMEYQIRELKRKLKAYGVRE